MNSEEQNSPTNRDAAADGGTADQPSAMPYISPPSEASYALPTGAGKRSGATAALRNLGVLLFWLLVSVLIVSLLLPTLARLREQSRRSVCAANLKGIGTGIYSYANTGADEWPTPFDRDGELIPTGGVDYVNAISSYRGKLNNPSVGDITKMNPVPSKISNTRCLWILVSQQFCTQKSLVCPSSNDMINADASPATYWDFGVGDIGGPATPGQVRQGWEQVSYGYQIPFGRHGRPSSDCDLRMPLAADKGPFSAALDGGLPSPPNITADVKSSSDQWRPWNSPNHGGQGSGEGQNVLYADGYVGWASKPIVGMYNDNIYTQQSGGELGKVQGNRPTAGGKQTPASDTDTLIYP